MRNTLLGSRIGLVNVDATDGTTELGSHGADVTGLTTDGVVKDEDADRSGAIINEGQPMCLDCVELLSYSRIF